MPSYVALLRGVNVSGHNPLSMPDLRAVVEQVAGPGARTYLQSGNVVFSSDGDDADTLAGAIRDGLSSRCSLKLEVLLRSGGQLEQLVAANPFVGDGVDDRTLHVTFLAGAPEAKKVAAAGEAATSADASFQLATGGTEVYLSCPNGYGRTKLNNAFFERRLAVIATTRNWRTVRALAAMARP